MVKFVDEETSKIKKAEFDEKMNSPMNEETRDYSSLKINWVEDCKTWEEVKENNLNLLRKEKVEIGAKQKLFFSAHSKDKIKGKPQLIENTKRRIVLVRKIQRIVKENLVTQYKFLGDLYDKRYDGQEVQVLALDFWMYRVIDDGGMEYFVLTDRELPNENCEFRGMLIELDDFAEMSRSMKIKSLSRVFIMKDCEPNVKIIPKESLIEYTKENQITEEDWLDFLAYHENGSLNRFPKEVELLRSAFVLSGKCENYPLHLGIMGKAGTKKTMGHIETLSYKFSEEPSICEGANSRIKGLSPSFKEKPANVGYLAKQERMGWIDEIGKMVEQEMNKHQQQTGNHLGELNFLLEHKKRTVGSGNDNDCKVQATAKQMFVTNPVSNRQTIHSHVGIIDPTTMSRILWWVQDYEETEFVLSQNSIINPLDSSPHTSTSISMGEERKKGIVLKMCWGKVKERNDFLTLFDSCYSFVSEIKDSEIQKIVNETTLLAKEPMKSSVWKPRASHHVKLLVDGLVKHRCLFKDYDSSFIVKEEDYHLARKILFRMIKSWDTNFSLDKRPVPEKLKISEEKI